MEEEIRKLAMRFLWPADKDNLEMIGVIRGVNATQIFVGGAISLERKMQLAAHLHSEMKERYSTDLGLVSVSIVGRT